jgi:hypothetical protein
MCPSTVERRIGVLGGTHCPITPVNVFLSRKLKFQRSSHLRVGLAGGVVSPAWLRGGVDGG